MNNYACGMLLSYGLTCVALVVIVFCSYVVVFLFVFRLLIQDYQLLSNQASYLLTSLMEVPLFLLLYL